MPFRSALGGFGMRRSMHAPLLTVIVLLAAGCGIQEKKENADRIRDSIEKLAQHSTASAQLGYVLGAVTVLLR